MCKCKFGGRQFAPLLSYYCLAFLLRRFLIFRFLLTRHLTTLLPSWTPWTRTATRTLRWSCSCCVTTWPSGPQTPPETAMTAASQAATTKPSKQRQHPVGKRAMIKKLIAAKGLIWLDRINNAGVIKMWVATDKGMLSFYLEKEL